MGTCNVSFKCRELLYTLNGQRSVLFMIEMKNYVHHSGFMKVSHRQKSSIGFRAARRILPSWHLSEAFQLLHPNTFLSRSISELYLKVEVRTQTHLTSPNIGFIRALLWHSDGSTVHIPYDSQPWLASIPNCGKKTQTLHQETFWSWNSTGVPAGFFFLSVFYPLSNKIKAFTQNKNTN